MEMEYNSQEVQRDACTHAPLKTTHKILPVVLLGAVVVKACEAFAVLQPPVFEKDEALVAEIFISQHISQRHSSLSQPPLSHHFSSFLLHRRPKNTEPIDMKRLRNVRIHGARRGHNLTNNRHDKYLERLKTFHQHYSAGGEAN
jgi:hypothetical protein